MKRLFDIFVCIIALPLLMPVFLLISLLVFINIGSPIFFCQLRPGKDGKIFKMVKFRTMNEYKSADGKLLADEIRLTKFGKFLRSTSLDELPELWNVLVGEMSLVGPRPLLVDYLPLYSDRQLRRHLLRPGITGWAQVNGRNAIDWNERFELDIWYVDNRTLILDLKILLLTIKKVLLREGISANGEATMTRFSGNQEGQENL